MTLDYSRSIDDGIRFLNKSRIRNKDGSVNGAYDSARRKPVGVYREITGYAISTAWICAERAGEAAVRVAREAAGYFSRLRRAGGQRTGAFSHSYRPSGGSEQDCYFSFDNAIILQGLALHRDRIPGEVDIALIREGADWLVDRMQNPDGSFKAYLDVHGCHRPEQGQFFHDGGSLHAKHAIALLRAYRALGDARHREAAYKVCRWAMGLQDPARGFFWADARRDHVFAHGHCYAAEGLAYAYQESGERDFLEAALKAGSALAECQKPGGGIPAFPRDARPWRRRLRTAPLRGLATDATAQAVDLWLYLDLATGEARFAGNVDRACRRLLSLQIGAEAADPDVRGAFRYREKTAWGFDSSDMLRTWASQFSVRALIHAQSAAQGTLTAASLMETWN